MKEMLIQIVNVIIIDVIYIGICDRENDSRF